MNRLFKVMPQHLNRIQVRNLTRPLQSLHFVFLQPFRGGFAGVFLDHCPAAEPKFASAWGHKQMAGHCPSGFFGRQQNSWFHLSQQVFQVLKQHNSPRPSHYHHHTLLLVWCSFSEMLCYFYARCNGTHTFQKVQLLSRVFSQKSWGSSRCFLAKLRWAFMFFLLSSGFGLGTLPCRPFLPSLFLMVESWTLTLTEASEACSSLDVVVGSFVTSWMSRSCALGVILVGRLLLGRFTTVPCFRHLWIMALTVVRWSPKALEMAL